MIGTDILKLKGQRIKDVISLTLAGYDCGFRLVTESGLEIDVDPYAITEHSGRVKIREHAGPKHNHASKE
jgi:hypothetical protein